MVSTQPALSDLCRPASETPFKWRFAGGSTVARFYTVNSEIFARVLFSRNFAYAKFRENKILAKWRNLSVVYWYR